MCKRSGMNRWSWLKWCVVLLLFAFSPVLWASDPNQTPPTFTSSADLQIGYRNDKIDWHEAGDNSANPFPNVASEEKYEDIQSAQAKLTGRLFKEAFFIRGYIDYGMILDGDGQTTTYAGDFRSNPTANVTFQVDGDYVGDASVGVGYPFKSQKGTILLVPLIGYSYHVQNLKMTDVFSKLPATGAIEGLSGTYDLTWKSPWIGLDFYFKDIINAFPGPSQRPTELGFHAGLEYHLADYEGEKQAFYRGAASTSRIEEEADAEGYIFNAGMNFHSKKNWSWNVDLGYQLWAADYGTVKIVSSNGAQSERRLNRVEWNSFSIMFGLTYMFSL